MSIQENKIMTLADGKLLYDDLRGRMNMEKAPIIIDSASGNPIAISDGVPGLKMYDMKVSFAPKQEGTGDPSPTNIRPITGWDGVNIHQGGKNLLDVVDTKRIVFNAAYSNFTSENGIVTITGNATGGYIMPCLPETDYVYSFESTYIGENLAVRVYEFTEYPTVLSSGVLIVNDNSSVARNIPPKTFTTTSTGKWLVVGFYAHHSENITIQKMQIELGSTATAYEPYSGTTIPISWQTEAGTVYGGELDVTTGVLTVAYGVASAKKTDFGALFENGIGYRQTSARYEPCLSGTNWNIARQTQVMPNGVIANPYSETTYGEYVGVIYQIEPSEVKATLRISEALYQTLGDNDEVLIVYKLRDSYTVQLTTSQIALLAGTNTIWTDADAAEIAYPIDTKKYVDAGVRDVQLNGASILNNGVANIPIAGANDPGVVKIGSWYYGISLMSNGMLYVSTADPTVIKQGSVGYRGIAPQYQHEAVFYGLSKLAGVDLANETVTLGQYPDAAKVAIQKMLGIYDPPWELIRSDSFTNTESADYAVTVDQYGEPFELMEVVVQVVVPKDADTKITGYGAIMFHYGDGGDDYRSVLLNNFTGPKSVAWCGSGGRIKFGNAVSYIAAPYSESGNNRALTIRNQQDFSLLDPANPRAIKKVTFRSVQGQLNYIIYGKRKWA